MNDYFEKLSKAFDEKLTIAIDFDETITTNISVWLKIINTLKLSGFHVICCTSRYPSEYPEDLDIIKNEIDCYFTSRKGKRQYLKEKSINVNIWIDDYPEGIISDII